MNFHIQLLLISLWKLQQNINITSYRKYLNFYSEDKKMRKKNPQTINFFFKYNVIAPVALRAINLKQYKFGFDFNLFPLKKTCINLFFLQKLSLNFFFNNYSLTSLGLKNVKYNHREKVKKLFFENKKKINYRFIINKNCYDSLFLWNFFIPKNYFFLISLNCINFYSFLTPLNSGFFFLKFLEKTQKHQELSDFDLNILNQLSFIFNFFFFSNFKFFVNLYALDVEDFLYKNNVKSTIRFSYAEYSLYNSLIFKNDLLFIYYNYNHYYYYIFLINLF